MNHTLSEKRVLRNSSGSILLREDSCYNWLQFSFLYKSMTYSKCLFLLEFFFLTYPPNTVECEL